MNRTPKLPVSPYLALIGGVCAVSTGAIFARLADAPALVVAAYRVGLACLILLPVAFWKARSELKTLKPGDFWMALASGFFLALHFAAWISSLDYTSVANSVVLVNTNPLWVGLLAPLIAKEKIGRATMVGIAASVAGGFIIGLDDAAQGGRAVFGDVLALAGGICAACYLLIGRRLRRKLSLLAYIMVCYGSAALILWGVVWLLDLPVTGFNPKTVKAFWAMALIPQLIGHTSANWALRHFSAALVAVSLLGEPLGSTILAYLIFDEGLTWTKAIGGAVILGAVYVAASGEKPEAAKRPSDRFPFKNKGQRIPVA